MSYSIGKTDQFVVPKFEFIETNKRTNELVSYLIDQKSLAVDTETTGLDPFESEMILLQLCTKDNKSFIFDSRKVDIGILKPVLENNSILKILANAKFDYKMFRLAKNGADIVLNNIFDVMLAEDILTAGLSNHSSALDTLSRNYLGIVMSKETRKEFTSFTRYDTPTHKAPFSQEQLQYSALDVYVLHDIAECQTSRLKVEETTQVAELEFNACIPIAEMEIYGVKVDPEKWEKIITDVTTEHKRMKKDIRICHKIIERAEKSEKSKKQVEK